MNISLVSQCTKRALTQVRCILDQFAAVYGERTWQTPITQQGLDSLLMRPRKTALKNTQSFVTRYVVKTTVSCFGWWVMPNNLMHKVLRQPT